MKHLLEAAQYYKNLGYSVIAVGADKKSISNWRQYQHVIIGQNGLEISFKSSPCNRYSYYLRKNKSKSRSDRHGRKNDLQCQLFRQFVQTVETHSPALLAKLSIAVSRNRGYHFFYKCIDAGMNAILARRLSTHEELQSCPEQKVRVLIEPGLMVVISLYILLPVTDLFKMAYIMFPLLALQNGMYYSKLLEDSMSLNHYRLKNSEIQSALLIITVHSTTITIVEMS